VENNSTWTPSAPSPTTWSRKSFPVVLTIVAGLGILPIVLISNLLYFSYLFSTGQISHHIDPALLPVHVVVISQLVTYVPLMAYLLAIVPYLANRSLAELGVRMPRWRDLGIGAAGALVMWLSVSAVAQVLSTFTHSHETESAVKVLREVHSPAQVIGFVAVAVVFAPIVEEFAFRVFLFNAIARYSTVTIGAAISGILFGLVHIVGMTDQGGVASALLTIGIPLSFGGFVLAMVYARTGCYWANVLTHGLFNAASVIAVLVFHVSDS
jgi:membrane protease YdiL (CAAX protease family)